MAIFDKVSEFAKSVGDKTSGAIETTKLDTKISAEQSSINAIMAKIGEFYYNRYAETGTADEGITEFCAAIDGHNAAIADAKAEIERIKAESEAAASAPAAAGGLICSSCGKPGAADRKFCSECGGKLDAEKRICACGAQVVPGKKFCGECGAKIEEEGQ